ncbi:MAG: helix-turn-helix transcriptional regulator [Anaerolineae bacterium]|nr:helix-turn-helix transcriptional regulator [Anaerolineae bacterium]
MDQISEVELRQIAKEVGALQSVLRLRVLIELARGDSNVMNLAERLHISQPLLSWHLLQLRQAGLVGAERVGREVRYSFQEEAFRELIRQLERLL